MDTEENARDGSERRPGGFLRSRSFALVRLAVSLAIVAGLILKLSPGDLARTLRDADPGLLVAALALMFSSQVMVIVKWAFLLRARGVRPPAALVARSYCIGNLLSTVLPTAIGGDVYRVYRVQREPGARAADVAMSVLYERATGYAAMTSLGVLGAVFYYRSAWTGGLVIVAGVAAAVGAMLLLPRLPLPALREGHLLRQLMSDRRELVAVYQAAVFSVPIQVVYISSIAIAGRSFGIHVSWWYWAFATWLVAVALLLPIAIGGLGVRESSFSALLKHAGATAAQGASSGFALGALLVAANAIGLVLIEAAERLRARRQHAAPAPAAEPQG